MAEKKGTQLDRWREKSILQEKEGQEVYFGNGVWASVGREGSMSGVDEGVWMEEVTNS